MSTSEPKMSMSAAYLVLPAWDWLYHSPVLHCRLVQPLLFQNSSVASRNSPNPPALCCAGAKELYKKPPGWCFFQLVFFSAPTSLCIVGDVHISNPGSVAGCVTLPNNVFKLLGAVPAITVQGVHAGHNNLFHFPISPSTFRFALPRV